MYLATFDRSVLTNRELAKKTKGTIQYLREDDSNMKRNVKLKPMFILEKQQISKTPVVQRNVLKTLAANALQISKSRLTLAANLVARLYSDRVLHLGAKAQTYPRS